VPYHKPDISLPADIVEEIVRIDGLDNIEIPESITITPAVEEQYEKEVFRGKVANYLVGQGFNEIMTNSITNAAYFSEEEQSSMVTMMNSLSAELNILRNSLFETSLEVVAHNLNHKNNSLRLFEFGKAYSKTGSGKYAEAEKLCLVITGNKHENSWKEKAVAADFYNLKGAVAAVLTLVGVSADAIETLEVPKLDNHIIFKLNNNIIAGAGTVKKNILDKFGIKQPVYFAGLNWSVISELAAKQKNKMKEIPKYPAVQRDLAMIVAKDLPWEEVQKTVEKVKLNKLQDIKLFDIFESEKLGTNKKSLAVNFTFQDEEKTLTDKEIDGWMNKIMTSLEKDLQAEIRK
jgi:phenylalanyl-tRNA synthetase beta chain